MSQRGRPKIEEREPQRIFSKTYVDDDGVKEIWYYNLDKFLNGPVKVDIIYPAKYKSFVEINEELPPTKRKYFNPETEDYVGYGRAKQLGLI